MESRNCTATNLVTIPLFVGLFVALLLGTSACFGDEDPPASSDVGVDADATGLDSGDDTADTDTKNEIGEPCFGPQDCVEGASCIGTGQNDQFVCMENCTEAGRICDDGSVCTSRLASADPICFTAGTTPRGERCDTNLDCEPGTLCFGSDNEYYCLQACHELDPGVCPQDTYCDTISESGKGLCRTRVGAGCTSSADCTDTLTCSEELGDAFAGLLPGGYCTQSECSADADCPGDSVCRTFPDTSTAICVATCATDGDCRFNADYRCLRDGYCNEVSNPEGCEAFRAGEDVCFPVALIENF
ncbi:hypothetical protein FIV42_29440 [Persicimonas caeni]|uniref:Uncharacterized protein n=1 Tax=Persicimonas caeni TaxID=2292766 RepID=A0A4Y6Q2P4_PERCE|nr:hypothetical protein [Persicimonas caeni]QDG54720.1 hypothetical protein FIV42_29440 [Persicimonas caeni]QED35941.1 hypothetical protein FRD00_29435 [Persicimonas caeni]